MAGTTGFYRLVLEYHCPYTANIPTISGFNALSIGSSPEAAVFLCIKRGGDNHTEHKKITCRTINYKDKE